MLAQVLEHPDRADSHLLDELVTEDFSSVPLHPQYLETVYQADGFIVRRADLTRRSNINRTVAGPTGLAKAIRSWLKPAVDADTEAHVKLKLYRVEPSPTGAAARVLVTISYNSNSRRTQVNATWNCDWSSQADNSLRLQTIDIESYEEVVASDDALRLDDCTASILGANACW